MTSKNVTYLTWDNSSPAQPYVCSRPGNEGNYYLFYLWVELCRSISVSSDNECIQIYSYSSPRNRDMISNSSRKLKIFCLVFLTFPSRGISQALLSSTLYVHFLLWQTVPHPSQSLYHAPQITNFINSDCSWLGPAINNSIFCLMRSGTGQPEDVSDGLEILTSRTWA